MKRPGKCVNKKAYAYKGQAINAAKNRYLSNGVHLGMYECPTCLDFHLTSQYCNLKHLHEGWRAGVKVKKKRKKKTQQPVTKIIIRNWEIERQKKIDKIKRRVASQYQEFLTIEKAVLSRIEQGLTITRPKQNYKKQVLPLAEQKRILAELDKRRNPQPKSFWSRMLGIIE